MNHELIQVIDQIAREKGIAREVLIETLESALVSAARKRYGTTQPLKVRVDPKNGAITIQATKRVVEQVANPADEISLAEAQALDPMVQVGGEVTVDLEFNGFGRIAAQTAKQVVVQRVKEVEREIIFNEYKDRVGQLLNGVVLRYEKGNYIVDLGRTEAILPAREQNPRESYKRGDRIRAYLLDVRPTPRGPQITLSRAHPGLVARLFEMEVPEIYEGIIEIKGVVREAGDRTKITVASKDPAVDPVGACVGMKGSRVQSVVRELRGEKIDIVPWTDDPRTLIAKALSPAVVEKVGVKEESRTALVVVSDQQLSLAIGRKGQNVRLAAKLTGWKIDILSESEYEQIRAQEMESQIEAAIARERERQRQEEQAAAGGRTLADLPGVGPKTAEALEAHGYGSVLAVAQASEEALARVPGIGPKTAQRILEAAQAALQGASSAAQVKEEAPSEPAQQDSETPLATEESASG